LIPPELALLIAEPGADEAAGNRVFQTENEKKERVDNTFVHFHLFLPALRITVST
jgi:hypothetical protein